MDDCKNTAEFLAEWARMHDAQQRDEHGFPKETCTGDNCIGCPLDIGLDCKEFAFRNINHAINKVQKWSDEHPAPKPKTYADDFFEKHPDARGYVSSGIRFPVVMWCHVYGECREHKTECSYTQRERCWNKPYKEE